jgi:diguanylate cyclase (GGDEF)-like protein
MTTDAGPAAYAALCRMLEGRTGLAALGVLALRGHGWEFCHATAAFRALQVSGTSPMPGEPPAPEATLAEPLPLRLPPAVLGLNAAVCFVQPIPGIGGRPVGFIVAASRRVRRAGPRLASALADAAAIARPLLAARVATGPQRPPPPAAGGPAGSGPAASGRQPAAPAVVGAHARAGRPASGESPPAAAPPSAPTLPRAAAHQLVASLLHARSRGEPLAVVMLDIDRFRAINEALGAEAGDMALAESCRRIKARLCSKDRIVRLEGDRFLILTSGARRNVRNFAEELLAAVAAPIDLPGRRLVLSASVGVVAAGPAETSPVRLMMQADTALRRAKAAGGNRLEIHEPVLHAALLDRSLLELDLRHALGNGELGLAYQPYVDLETGETDGVEALLRWRHPTRGEVAPATFIPLAEASGLILPIGMWALRSACAAASALPGRFALSVNISPLQFHAPGFVAEVDAVLAATGFPAHRLELEITETVLMRDNPETTAQLRSLIARGIRIALDDFGTGYSALAYLSRLPHHRIKLDKSFVQDMARPSTAGLVRAIIALARAGGIATTAEGVERPEDLAAVRAIGFSHAQGFATGSPIEDPARIGEAAPAG